MARNIERPEINDSNLADNHAIVAVVTSTGKSGHSIAANFSTALARREKRACLITTENNSIQSEQNSDSPLEGLLNEQNVLAEMLFDGAGGVQILPAGNIFSHFPRMGKMKQELLINLLATLEAAFDYVIVDVPAEADKELLHLFKVAPILLSVTPQADALTTAFELLRQLKHKGVDNPIQIVVENATSLPHAHESFKKLQLASARYLRLEAHYLGYLPLPQIRQHGANSDECDPDTAAGNQLDNITERFCALHRTGSATPSLSCYYRALCSKEVDMDFPTVKPANPDIIKKEIDSEGARTGAVPENERKRLSDRAALLAASGYASLLAQREAHPLSINPVD